MPLTTRCGACGRQFPVYAQQLKGTRTRVACPQCGARMDAVAGLIEEPGFPGRPAANRGPTRGDAPRSGAGPSARRPPPTPAMVPAGAPTGPRVRTIPVPAVPVRRAARSQLGWGAVSVILIAALSAQLAWWWRADLLRNPRVFRTLSSWCATLGCRLTPARLPGALAVHEPSLTPDPISGVLMLRLRVENSAELPQPVPLIELELYDRQGDLAAARRFSPQDYAAAAAAGDGAGAAVASLLAPGESRTVALALAPPREAAAGFKVRLR